MFYGAKPSIFENARLLRLNMTVAEKILWEKLKNNQLGLRFKAQHPIAIFVVDFYCHKCKLVIELDGKIHELQKDYDEGRTAELERFDLKVIRFTNEEVEKELSRVVETIKEIINQRCLVKT